MNLRTSFVPIACLLALLALAACGPEPSKLTPTPPVNSNVSNTPAIVQPEPTTLPTDTIIPPTPTEAFTPTPVNTPTETAQPTFISTPGVGPTVVMRPGINVAKAEYDAALARWNAQNIEEYEMVVEHDSNSPWAGTWDLRVTDSGDTVEVISYANPTGVPVTPGVGGDTVKFLTVEQQFAAVDHVLTAGVFGDLEALVDYVVVFDPNLGYPASLSIQPKPNVKATNLGSSTTIKSINILKRGTPTAPETPTEAVSPTP